MPTLLEPEVELIRRHVRLDELPSNEELLGPPPSKSFARNIEIFGVRHPIELEADGDRYIVRDGRTRIKTARWLGLETIPATISPKGTYLPGALDLSMNHQRRRNSLSDLDALESLEDQGKSWQEISALTGISPGMIKRVRKLRQLVPALYRAVRNGLSINLAIRCASLDASHQGMLVELLNDKGKLTKEDVDRVCRVSTQTAFSEMFEQATVQRGDRLVEALKLIASPTCRNRRREAESALKGIV